MNLKKLFIGVLLILILAGSLFITLKVVKTNNIQDESKKSEHQDEKKDYIFNFFEPREIQDKPYHRYMTYANNIYYKKITNYDEYLECKEMWNGILDMSEDDFNSKFMFITIIENYSMLDLSLGEMYSDDNTLYVGLKKVLDQTTNAGISIIADKQLDREKIEVYKTVDEKKSLSNYSEIRKLPYEYSKEQAIEDKCLVIGEDNTYNIDVYNDFVSKVDNKEDAEIRVKNDGYNGTEIIDIAYLKDTEKFIVCIDRTRAKEKWTYNYYEYTDFETSEDDRFLRCKFINNIQDENEKNTNNSLNKELTITLSK